MPAYDNNTPLATQAINQTQSPIRTNFDSLKLLIDINHVDFADPINFGKHFFIQMPAAVPVTATAAGEIGLYSKNGTASLQPELFFQRQGGVADTGTPMTERDGTSPGWTYLPSGLKMIWGSGQTAGATKLVTYASTAGGGLDSFPGFATFAIPFVTRVRVGAATTTNMMYVLSTYSTISFTAASADSANGTQFVWWAIGI